MLLDRVEKVFSDPFPHVVIENALPEDYYRRLIEEIPSPEQIVLGRPVGKNQRIDLPTELAMVGLSPIWRKFCALHVSNDFYLKACKVFGIQPVPARLRCQPGINTPTDQLSRVRGPHLDNPCELYAGLFYTPLDEDGGNLEIYRWKGERRFHGKLEIHDDCVELVKTIPYKANTYVMFLNSDKAIHGVSARKSDSYRRLVNVIADVQDPLFVVGHGRY